MLTQFGAAVLVAGLAMASACAPATPPAHGNGTASARPLYKPGASLAARLCECRECLEATCCDGDREDDETSPTNPDELGIAVKACGRCIRRTWTARGTDPCSEHAPAECCAGSVAG